jgi:hypothetical protein
MGASNATCEHQLDILNSFLQQAGSNPTEPLYFCWKPDSNVSFEPLWGQFGAFRRVEIIAADSRSKWDEYLAGNIRSRAIIASIGITINSVILGKDQLLGVAYGGIMEDTAGVMDGVSRGLIIPETTTNKMTNPVFGNSTWNNGWTASAGIQATKNINREFILFGNCSAKLIGGAAGTFTQSIAAGNTNKHSCEFYMKRPDGAAVTAADVICYYAAGSRPTTYIPVGNGWYKISAENFNGIAAASIIGVYIGVGIELYLSGAMFVEKTYNVWMAYGDMMGCAWTGAAHATTSTRTQASYRLPIDDTTFNYGQWTARIVWKSQWSITGLLKCFMVDNTTNLKFTFTVQDKFNLTDGTNTAESAALTIVAGTIYILHITASLSGLAIYRNGISIASAATYTPPAVGTHLYLGTYQDLGNRTGGTYMDFSTFDRAMTGAEVLADYNNISSLVSSGDGMGKCLSPIPWLWTKDGDSVTDNYVDATHDPQAIINGVPGDLPARTIWYLTLTNHGDSLIVSHKPWPTFVRHSIAFSDMQGTAVGGALGGEATTHSVATGSNHVITDGGGTDSILIRQDTNYFLGDKGWLLVSLNDAGAGLQSDIIVYFGSVSQLGGKWNYPVADGTLRVFLVGPISLPSDLYRSYSWLDPNISLDIFLYLTRSTGTNNIQLDWLEYLSGNVVYIDCTPGDPYVLLIDGKTVYGIDNVSMVESYLTFRGDVALDLVPNKYNSIVSYSGDKDAATVLANTLTFTKVIITPRYLMA